MNAYWGSLTESRFKHPVMTIVVSFLVSLVIAQQYMKHVNPYLVFSGFDKNPLYELAALVFLVIASKDYPLFIIPIAVISLIRYITATKAKKMGRGKGVPVVAMKTIPDTQENKQNNVTPPTKTSLLPIDKDDELVSGCALPVDDRQGSDPLAYEAAYMSTAI